MIRSRGVCLPDFFRLEERARENLSTYILVPFHCVITTCSVIAMHYWAQAGNKMLSAPVLSSRPSLSNGRGKKALLLSWELTGLTGPAPLGKAGLQEQNHPECIPFTCPPSAAKTPRRVTEGFSSTEQKSYIDLIKSPRNEACQGLAGQQLRVAFRMPEMGLRFSGLSSEREASGVCVQHRVFMIPSETDLGPRIPGP